jgi:uncharacterized protein YjiK
MWIVPDAARALSTHVVPLKEVSGIAVSSTPAGVPMTLVAVADEDASVVVATVDDNGPRRWRVVDLSAVYSPPKEGSNFEGVAVDADGVIVIVAEHPPSLLVFRPDPPAGLRRVGLSVDSARALTGLRFKDLRAEGLVLLREGHVLVASEKDPPGLLEFGPPEEPPLGMKAQTWLPATESFACPTGDGQYHALAWWPLANGLAGISDLAVHAGRLYALSDEDAAIGLVADGPYRQFQPLVTDTWRLQVADDELTSPEGMAFLPDGSYFVVYDRKSTGPNLLWFAPLSRDGR